MKKIAIYNPYLETKGGGEKVSLALAAALKKNFDADVYFLTHTKVDLPSLGDYFKIDVSKIKVIVLKIDSPLFRFLYRLPLPGRVRHLISDAKVMQAVKKLKFDMFINNCYQSNLPNPAKVGVYMCMFPQKLTSKAKESGVIKSIYVGIMRRAYRLFLHPAKRHAVYTYQLITANSAYTQDYIQKYWGLDSQILYPICESMQDNKHKKEKIILHVGRFFENMGDNHHKRQDFLLATFAKMKSLHKAGWQLYFVGSVAEDTGTLKYLLGLIKSAEGLPVHFRFNCAFNEMKDLFNKSQIYWHATGFGSDQKKHPEKQEHFGISTVEAMSTGAVPIVYNTAGQKESVISGKNGYLYNTQQELIDFTNKVADMDSRSLASMQDAAQATAKKFDDQAFEKLVDSIFGEMVR